MIYLFIILRFIAFFGGECSSFVAGDIHLSAGPEAHTAMLDKYPGGTFSKDMVHPVQSSKGMPAPGTDWRSAARPSDWSPLTRSVVHAGRLRCWEQCW